LGVALFLDLFLSKGVSSRNPPNYKSTYPVKR
jgi:hypothetical protein